MSELIEQTLNKEGSLYLACLLHQYAAQSERESSGSSDVSHCTFYIYPPWDHTIHVAI